MRGGSVRFRVTACFALKRTASVILPVLHNTMRCSLINLYTNLHNHSRTPNFKCPRYTIYIYIIDYSNTFITHFAPFLPSSSNLSYSATYLFLYIYIYIFLIPIYKFYLTLREILSLISHRLSRK